MAAGDVTAEVVAATTAAVDTALTAMRVTANDKWMMAYIGNGQIMLVHIEEA